MKITTLLRVALSALNHFSKLGRYLFVGQEIGKKIKLIEANKKLIKNNYK